MKLSLLWLFDHIDADWKSIDVIERLQKMPKTFPMMKDPALMLRLTTAKAELKYGQELHNAVAENDRARVKLLLEHPDIDLNFRRPEYKNQDIVAGCTPLMVYVSDIAYDKYSEYVKSAQNNNGDLYDADVATGRHSCIPKHEPRPVTKDTHDFLTGQKFKHLLAYNFIMPEKEISQLLIEAGANVNTPDKDGWTPLIRAANKHSHAMVESLLEAGAHMKRNGCCSAPLTWAVYSGDLEFVKKFIDAGADVNARNGIDSTALWVASNNCDSRENGDNFHKIIGMLLAAGANPDFKGYNGKTPLIQIITNALECHRPCIEEAKTLLLFGDANPDICDKYGKTACDYVTAEIALLTTKELDDKIRYRLRNCQELKTLLEKASLERKQNIAPGCAIA